MTRVVVVGGGIAGTTFVRSAAALHWDITLVDPKEFFELPIAALRALMDPDGFGKKIRKTYRDLLGVRHIQAKLAGLSVEKARLDNGEEVPFDYAVIATGSSIRGFDELKVRTNMSLADRESQWRLENEKLRTAKSVVILGGGPIGVELAGEIAETFPGTTTTLIEQKSHLLPALGEAAGAKARSVLERLGVEIITSASASVRGGMVVLSSGRTIAAERIYQSLGVATETGFLSENFPGAINEHHQAKVDEYLRLKGTTNIFVLGDVSDVPEIKLGYVAAVHARLTVSNIRASLTPRRLKPYRRPRGSMGLVTLGRKAGIAKLPFGRMDFMIGIKQKDMFTSMYLKAVKPPLKSHAVEGAADSA